MQKIIIIFKENILKYKFPRKTLKYIESDECSKAHDHIGTPVHVGL